ncbi:MAG: P1 family peptidase [Desulfobacteraceae bacterium]|nr:P1 family peptidase [Desulfobacteraceae bacterium]
MPDDTLTAIEGIRVGHAEIEESSTGCTVVLFDRETAAGVDIRGGAPGTFGTDSLNPLNLVSRVHGLFFAGGSAFGLSAAEGVRKYLAERKVGFESGHGLIPIVAGAIIFDLALNRTGIYPGPDLAYAACRLASPEPVPEGNLGAGLGATVGKLFGFDRCMKGGVGSSCIYGAEGVKVAALMVVNAFGEIVDPSGGVRIAGVRKSSVSRSLADTMPEVLRSNCFGGGFPCPQATVVGVVATNAALNKVQLTKVAQMAHDGLARAVYPVHTQYDGDTVFAVSCGDIQNTEVSLIGALAAMAVTEAILRGVRKARSLHGIPAAFDIEAGI